MITEWIFTVAERDAELPTTRNEQVAHPAHIEQFVLTLADTDVEPDPAGRRRLPTQPAEYPISSNSLLDGRPVQV
ncbi:MAG: hypothetical protein ABI542_12880 [Gemmatimonadota bacterium]